MDCGALKDALESRRRFGVFQGFGYEHIELIVEILDQITLKLFHLDTARTQNRDGVLIVCQRQQQMLQCRILVPPFGGV